MIKKHSSIGANLSIIGFKTLVGFFSDNKENNSVMLNHSKCNNSSLIKYSKDFLISCLISYNSSIFFFSGEFDFFSFIFSSTFSLFFSFFSFSSTDFEKDFSNSYFIMENILYTLFSPSIFVSRSLITLYSSSLYLSDDKFLKLSEFKCTN